MSHRNGEAEKRGIPIVIIKKAWPSADRHRRLPPPTQPVVYEDVVVFKGPDGTEYRSDFLTKAGADSLVGLVERHGMTLVVRTRGEDPEDVVLPKP